MKTVAGLDVHKDSVYLCILRENGEKIERVFGVLTPQLDSMRDFMAENEVSEVAMESTSVYWIPIWRVLVDSFELKLVNPYFIKQLPGRKSDGAEYSRMRLTAASTRWDRSITRDFSRLGNSLPKASTGIATIIRRCSLIRLRLQLPTAAEIF